MHQIEHWFFNLDPFGKGLFIYFLVLFIIWVWKYANNTLNEPVFSFFKPEPDYELAVNKKEFVCEVVRWGIWNLSYQGADQKRKKVNVEVSYYPHKKIHGVFCSSQNKIRIYVNNHPDIDRLIISSLHEVVHLLQWYSDKKNFQNRYYKLLQEKTYEKHPMEIEANKMAAEHTESCRNYLIATGKLRIKN